MVQSRENPKNKKDKCLITQFQDLSEVTKQIAFIYFAYIKSSGALGCDPRVVGSVAHWRKYKFFESGPLKITHDVFRSRARRVHSLVEKLIAENVNPTSMPRSEIVPNFPAYTPPVEIIATAPETPFVARQPDANQPTTMTSNKSANVTEVATDVEGNIVHLAAPHLSTTFQEMDNDEEHTTVNMQLILLFSGMNHPVSRKWLTPKILEVVAYWPDIMAYPLKYLPSLMINGMFDRNHASFTSLGIAAKKLRDEDGKIGVTLHLVFEHDQNPYFYSVDGARGFSLINVNLPMLDHGGNIIPKCDQYGDICYDENGEVIPQGYDGKASILQVLTVDKTETPKAKRQYAETIEMNLGSPCPPGRNHNRNPGFGSPNRSPHPPRSNNQQLQRSNNQHHHSGSRHNAPSDRMSLASCLESHHHQGRSSSSSRRGSRHPSNQSSSRGGQAPYFQPNPRYYHGVPNHQRNEEAYQPGIQSPPYDRHLEHHGNWQHNPDQRGQRQSSRSSHSHHGSRMRGPSPFRDQAHAAEPPPPDHFQQYDPRRAASPRVRDDVPTDISVGHDGSVRSRSRSGASLDDVSIAFSRMGVNVDRPNTGGINVNLSHDVTYANEQYGTPTGGDAHAETVVSNEDSGVYYG